MIDHIITYVVLDALPFLQQYPMAVVGTAQRQVIVYQLDGTPREFRTMESPLKFQVNQYLTPS